jgi:hypothetical protein
LRVAGGKLVAIACRRGAIADDLSALQGEIGALRSAELEADRRARVEQCYFTYLHSLLKDESGVMAGVLSTVIETTPRVLSERRMRVLRDLSNMTIEAANEARTVQETCRSLVGLLGTNNPDVPFAVQYLTTESGRAKLIAQTNLGQGIFPASVASGEPDAWGLDRALRERKTLVIEHRRQCLRPCLAALARADDTARCDADERPG